MKIKIDFTDITMIEGDGYFKKIKEIMENDVVKVNKWEIRTDVTILSEFGMAKLTIACFYNKDIFIMEYNSSSQEDDLYNPDIKIISEWAHKHGWNTLQPHKDLVDMNKEFWKYFHSTGLIDSEYLDKIYGKRD